MIQGIEDVGVSSPSAANGTSPAVDPHRFRATISSAGGGVARLALSGVIDLAVRDRLRQVVEASLVREGVKALLIDLTAVTFLDCGAIGMLVAGRHLAADIGCGYRVVNGTGLVARLLDLTGVRPVLELASAGAGDADRPTVPRSMRSD